MKMYEEVVSVSLESEAGVLLAFAVGMFGLFVFICMFAVPLKYAVRFVINSVIGGAAILLVNAVGAAFGVHIALNAVTAAVVGLLGLPGVLMILFLQAV